MKKYNILLIFACVIWLVSCDKFLSEPVDNRTKVDKKDKVSKILVSAYPEVHPALFLELMSDNVDRLDVSGFAAESQFHEQVWNWVDVTADDNESPKWVWGSYYKAIANANEALAAIEEMGRPADLEAFRGEALVCRAYAHFMLVNTFCLTYNPKSSTTDLGIPYMDHAETILNPKYERGNVAEVYAKLEKDLEEGLPLISDDAYTVPKYHFNRKAAYAFAARFYLYYQKYDKAIEAANVALGTSPVTIMRDWVAQGALDASLQAEQYIQAEHDANLMLATGASSMGLQFGPYGFNVKYRHVPYMANSEGVNAAAPWVTSTSLGYNCRARTYDASTYKLTEILKYPYMMEIKDAVAQVGVYRSIFVLFSAEETLLNRAEAYLLKGDVNAALEDMNLWVSVRCKPAYMRTLTEKSVNAFYDNLAYYTPVLPTVKKQLNPAFTYDPANENMLHCLLQMKRLETISDGLRWFDVQRYGIEIYRRSFDNNNVIKELDKLSLDDPRRAIQIPADVISAGLTPNPRL